jgi:hypothetical protein
VLSRQQLPDIIDAAALLKQAPNKGSAAVQCVKALCVRIEKKALIVEKMQHRASAAVTAEPHAGNAQFKPIAHPARRNVRLLMPISSPE